MSRTSFVGDDWSAAEDLEDDGERLAEAREQIAALEKQLVAERQARREAERNLARVGRDNSRMCDHIRELQAMVQRAHDEIPDPVALMAESLRITQLAKEHGIDRGAALKFVRELRKAG